MLGVQLILVSKRAYWSESNDGREDLFISVSDCWGDRCKLRLLTSPQEYSFAIVSSSESH